MIKVNKVGRINNLLSTGSPVITRGSGREPVQQEGATTAAAG